MGPPWGTPTTIRKCPDKGAWHTHDSATSQCCEVAEWRFCGRNLVVKQPEIQKIQGILMLMCCAYFNGPLKVLCMFSIL
jgi:hypothetical protein